MRLLRIVVQYVETASLDSLNYSWFLWQSKWEDLTSNTPTSIWVSVVVLRWLRHSCRKRRRQKIDIHCVSFKNSKIPKEIPQLKMLCLKK